MKTILINLPNGYSVRAVENTQSILFEIWNEKIYEKDLICIQANMTVLDIGANQGFFSLYAASKGARVFSVEPEKTNYAILSENIATNGLAERITTFHCAIARREGRLDLYLHDFDEEMGSAIVTTSRTFLKNIKRMDENIQVQETSCITLQALLEKIGMPRIDVMKIDCEGAEMDILASAPRESCARIHYLVMETHSNYSQKELVHVVSQLGFYVIGYEKIIDPTGTGYLFAENKNVASKPVWKQPVANMRAPQYVEEPAALRLDGSDSFSTEGLDTRLSYQWKIDGATVGSGDQPEANVSNARKGAHAVELIVTDGNGRSASVRQTVWILEKGYFAEKGERACRLEHATERLVTLDGTRFFSCSLPADWDPAEIKFSLAYTERGDFDAVFQFNGERIPLSTISNLFGVPHVTPGFVLNFSLTAPRKTTMKIKWWCHRARERRRPDSTGVSLSAAHPGVIVLEEDNIVTQTVSGEATFLIRHECFPSHWLPSYISIKVGTIDDNEHAIELKGFFTCGDYKTALDGWNKVIKLDYASINQEQDLVFQIINQCDVKEYQAQFWFE